MITVEKLEKGTYFDDAFKISFRYDPTTVAKVKELAERRYLPEDRAWEIPAHELPALIEKVGLSNIKSEEAVVQALNTKEIEDKREATLNKHFSNMGLLNGSGTLGKKPDTDGAKYLQEDYEKYITQLQQKSGFIVVTPDDFEGRKPNVDEIKSLAIKHGADMIVIDQLSLMSDKRRADIPRIAYNNISEDLFLMSKELKKPVLLMAQANREAVKNRKKGESPELHDLAESDGVGQNATRVLSLSVIDGTLKISVKKNRYGINNKEVLMIWEVNTGYLKPLLSENPEESTEDKKDDKPDGEHDKGGEKDYGF